MKPQIDKTNRWRQKSGYWLGNWGVIDLEEAEGNSWDDRNVLQLQLDLDGGYTS